ncbi:LuxR C-terminal-related transcriptional regulator [Zavarzinia sp. CC-PAN008]|uniref:LuxR C-terminal-related transcriptional regulator n=1 Tax=Zavarzinia sp. CC-PAN008 TaxID=3243332 RepID=UPI003F742CAF
MTAPRSILVADDHPLFREAVCLRLRAMFPDAELHEREDFLSDAATRALDGVDLALVDLCMPGVGSGAAIRRIVEACPGGKVVVMSGQDNAQEVTAGLQAGARGFIAKTMSPDQFRAALAVVVAGGTYAPTSLMLAQPPAPPPTASLMARLTPREGEVLRLLMRGASNKEICRALSLAEPTVKLHVSQVMRKLDVRNRSEAAVKGVQAGLSQADA